MQKRVVYDLLSERSIREGSFRLGSLLAFSIGILNAGTYLVHGHVFASSQSGNLLYMGLDLSRGDFSSWPKYLFPILLFACGIVIAELFRDQPDLVGWKKYPFGLEILIIIGATFLPENWDPVTNSLFGMACGLQTVTFKHIRDLPVATVVINSSFQNGVMHLTKFLHLKDDEDLFRGLLYAGLVLFYLAGIVVGGILVNWMHQYVTLCSAAVLLICAIFLLQK